MWLVFTITNSNYILVYHLTISNSSLSNRRLNFWGTAWFPSRTNLHSGKVSIVCQWPLAAEYNYVCRLIAFFYQLSDMGSYLRGYKIFTKFMCTNQ